MARSLVNRPYTHYLILILLGGVVVEQYLRVTIMISGKIQSNIIAFIIILVNMAFYKILLVSLKWLRSMLINPVEVFVILMIRKLGDRNVRD